MGVSLNALMYHIDNIGIVECFLRYGADVNETNSRGETALQYATSEAIITRLILAKGPSLQNAIVYRDNVSDEDSQARRDDLDSVFGRMNGLTWATG
jgi:ankyrin repeat protein